MYFLVNRQRKSVQLQSSNQHFRQANFAPKSSHSYQRKLLKTRTPSRNKNQREGLKQTCATSTLTRTVSCKERVKKEFKTEQRSVKVYNASQFFQLRKQLINLQNNFVKNSRPECLKIHQMHIMLTLLEQRISKIDSSLKYFQHQSQFVQLAQQLHAMLRSYHTLYQRLKAVCLLNQIQIKQQSQKTLVLKKNPFKLIKKAIVKKILKPNLRSCPEEEKIIQNKNNKLTRNILPVSAGKAQNQLVAIPSQFKQVKSPLTEQKLNKHDFFKLHTQLSQIPKFSSSSQQKSCRQCSESFLQDLPDPNNDYISTPYISQNQIQNQPAQPQQFSRFSNTSSSSSQLLSIQQSIQVRLSKANLEKPQQPLLSMKTDKKKSSLKIVPSDSEQKDEQRKKPRRNKSKVYFQQKPSLIAKKVIKIQSKHKLKSKRKKSDKQSDKHIPFEEKQESNSPQQMINKLMNLILHKPQGPIIPMFRKALNDIKGFDRKKEFLIGMITKFSQCLNDKAMTIFKSQVKAFLESEQQSLPQYIHIQHDDQEEPISLSQIQSIQRKLSLNISKMKFMKKKQNQGDFQQITDNYAFHGHYYTIKTQSQTDPFLLALRKTAFQQTSPLFPGNDCRAQQVGYQDQQLIKFKWMIKEVLKQFLLLKRNCMHLF